jgi:hypothetical protein
MREDKKYTDGIVIEKGRFLTWFDNFWYHYKWVTLVTAFFLVVFSVCIVQACTAEHDDLNVTYAGSATLSAEQQMEIEKALTECIPEEFGKDEDTNAGLLLHSIYSTERLVKLEETDENGNTVAVTDKNGDIQYVKERTFNVNEFNNLISQLQTGMGSVIIMDGWLYEEFLEASESVERFMPLKHVFGKKPECAIDDYAILLRDTQIYAENAAIFDCLPEDAVIVLHSELTFQKNYDKELIAFKAFAAQYEEND